MCLVTAIITPKLFGQDYYFTPYGIVSGIFWVPAGVAAVYSVQNAGLALSQGLWSSIIVLVAFVWGIFVFREGVRSKEVASLAVFIMCLGLWGMSFFSSSIGASASVSVNDGNLYQAQQQEQCLERNNDRNNDGDFCSEVATDSDGDENGTNERNAAVNSNDRSSSLGYEGLVNHSADTTYCSTSLGHDRHDDGILNAAEEIDTFRDDDEEGNDGDNDDNICHDSNLQYSQHEIIRRRRMGMAAAVFNGVWYVCTWCRTLSFERDRIQMKCHSSDTCTRTCSLTMMLHNHSLQGWKYHGTSSSVRHVHLLPIIQTIKGTAKFK